MRELLKTMMNGMLRPLGLRVVNTRWGPRGAWDALRRARAYGISPKQIVDIGASNGQWTRECLRIFPHSRYFLVDPLPANQAALKALQAENLKVHVWQGALGSAPGSLELYSHGDQSSFFSSDSFQARNTDSVEIRTMDSFLGTAQLQPPDFIKADVQGFELEVLKGATQCLKTVQLLLLEVSYRRLYNNAPLAPEIITAVSQWGFRIYDICTYVGRPSDGELVQSDLLFAAEGSPIFAREDYF